MENTQVLLNIVWTMVGAFLVYFMQAGFAMVETGFTRAKNSGNILMKNMMDFVLGSIFFFIIGFALMFGGSNAFIGTAGFFNPKSLADADGMFNGLPIGVFMIFQTVFCNDCIRSYGRENQIYLLSDLLRSDQRFHLSDHRTLDLGRRLVKPDRVP